MRLVPYGVLSFLGSAAAIRHPLMHPHTDGDLFIALVGTFLYAFFAFHFLHALTKGIYMSSVHRVGVGRASTVRFFLRVAGYVVIGLGLLAIIHIPLGRILVGSAVIGIILSVAAQQSLANFFASIVIIVDRTFIVGQKVAIVSGSFGGRYEGTVVDINFSHTTLKLENGSTASFPNAPLLSATAVIKSPREHDSIPKKHS